MDHTFSGLRGLWEAARANFTTKYEDPDALALLHEPVKPVHAFNPLVQISTSDNAQMEETRA